MSEFIVGLTGGIGSGKSRIAEAFVRLGTTLVDTDHIAHALTAPDGPALPALRAAFGDHIFDAAGALIRAELRTRVFADPAARTQLEQILHPMIRQEALTRCTQAETPYVLLAVPLLYEARATYQPLCPRILLIDCAESLQIQRVMQRNHLPEEAVRAMLAAQASRAERRSIATDILVNEDTLEALQPRIDALHQSFLHAAEGGPPAPAWPRT